MSKLRYSVALAVCLVALVLVPRAYADPITVTITGGSLDVKGVKGSISLTGTDGFSLVQDSLVAFEGSLAADIPGVFAPGAPVSLDADFGGNGLSPVVILGGTTYDAGTSGAQVSLAFRGSTAAPSFVDPTTAFVQAPFTFNGTFVAPGDSAPTALLAGSGIAFVRFIVNPFTTQPEWSPAEVRYDFAAVTPEPSSLLLAATGLAGLVGLIRKRRIGA